MNNKNHIKKVREKIENIMSVRKLVTDLRKGLAFSPIIVAPSELKIRLDKEDPFFSDELSREEVKETYFNLTLLH